VKADRAESRPFRADRIDTMDGGNSDKNVMPFRKRAT
jgi:hypothetical protein